MFLIHVRQMSLTLTFGVEELSLTGRTSITTLISITRNTLVAIASHDLIVASKITHWSHRLYSQDTQHLMVRYVQLAIQW